MNRRGFFGALAGLVATAQADPERLLWTPGRRLISIPEPRNMILTREMISRECLLVLQRTLQSSLSFEMTIRHPRRASA